MIAILISIVSALQQILILLVILSVILSYFMDPFHPIRRGLDRIVEPGAEGAEIHSESAANHRLCTRRTRLPRKPEPWAEMRLLRRKRCAVALGGKRQTAADPEIGPPRALSPTTYH